MSFVNEIKPNHFGCSMGGRLKIIGDSSVRFSNNGDDTMKVSITFDFKVDADKVNTDINPITINPEMGDLFVAEFDKELEMDSPENAHFLYDNNNTKISLMASIPPGAKGNHPM